MVETLQPRQYFPISRLLTDPTDNSTYYLQAVIRNAKTSAVIDTIDLSQVSGRLYAKNYQMPADPSGQGLFVTITTLVYTDSGHTTKSDAYGEEHEIYMIYDRFNFLQGLGSQIAALIDTSDATDYKKIKKIVDDAVEKGTNKVIEEMPEESELNVDLNPVLNSIAKVGEAVGLIDIKEPKEVNYALINRSIDGAVSTMAKKVDEASTKIIEAIPEQEQVDFTPILQALEKTYGKDFMEKTKDLISKVDNLVKADVSSTLEDVKKIKEAMYEFLFNFKSSTEKPMPTERETGKINRFGNLVKRQ